MIEKITRWMNTGSFLDSFISLLLASLMMVLLLIVAGYDPVKTISLFVCGAVGDVEAIYGSLMLSMPLIFSGLALALAFKAGLFNIGSEGQLMVGGITAAIIGHYLDLGPLTVVVMIISGAAVGFAWSLLPMIIKLKRGAHEVIGCLLMNYIAINLCLWLVRGPFRAEASSEKTPPVVPGGMWPDIDSIGATSFNSSFFVAIAVAIILAWILYKLPFGYELRATGENAGAARASGINTSLTLLMTFGLSGAISGMGGAAGVSGVYGAFNSQFSSGYGFDGITIALLGRNNPIGVILAAILFGMMRNSSKLLQWHADISPDIVFLFQGFVIVSLIAAKPVRNFIVNLFKTAREGE